MKPRFSFSFRETRFLFLETQDLSSISLKSFFVSPQFSIFSKTHQSSLNLNEGFFENLPVLPYP